MNAILSYLIQMLLPALAGAVLWAVFRPLRRRRHVRRGLTAGDYREGVLLIYVMFLAGLLALTLTPAGFWPALLRGEKPVMPPAFQGGINLVPITRSVELFQYYLRHGLWSAIWVNFPGNIVMFMPIGFFIGLLSDKPRWWKGALSALLLSVFIETMQLFVSRGTDVDDLILNTLGGLAGYWVFLLVRRWAPHFTAQCKLRKGRV